MKPYYEDDFVTIYHGDCREWLSKLTGADIRCTVTSPPYNTLGGRMSDRGGIHGGSAWIAKVSERGYADDMSEGEYAEWQADVAGYIARCCDPGASFFYNHKIRYRDGHPVHPIDLVRTFDGWRLRQELIWARDGGMALNARMFCPSDERIYWLVLGDAPHVWNQPSATDMTVWKIRQEIGLDGHPCPFPIGLPQRCIAATTAPNDTVLDPFMGSGTTLRAAKDLGRQAIGIEREERFCEIAAKRMAQEVLDFGGAA